MKSVNCAAAANTHTHTHCERIIDLVHSSVTKLESLTDEACRGGGGAGVRNRFVTYANPACADQQLLSTTTTASVMING